MKADLQNFLNPDAFKTIMTTQLGWFLGDFKVINGLAVVRPDFYDNNTVIATSKKAVIVCMGQSRFKINNIEYSSIQEAIERNGASILQSYSDWTWTEEKEWIIMKNDSGEWVKSCSTLSDFPFRKQVKC
tara:strand:- start:16572 stop:16961 length:390 start_codon:yes stop_codon:yes gene_type:complete